VAAGHVLDAPACRGTTQLEPTPEQRPSRPIPEDGHQSVGSHADDALPSNRTCRDRFQSHDDIMTSTSSSPTHDRIDPRPILDRAIAIGGSVIAGVRPHQLTAPTSCSEMDVRAMLGHLVAVLDRIAALGRGEDPFAVTEIHAIDDGWSDAWTTSASYAAEAWRDDVVLEQPMALPWIRGSGAEVLASYFSELTVHTWDLAMATGQRPDWDDTVVTAALAARDFLPAENRRALFEEISAAMGLDQIAIPFAEAVPIPDDAPAIDRLVAWNGRDPSP
jgi:uncharacterized protein (TIGR03086 family)